MGDNDYRRNPFCRTLKMSRFICCPVCGAEFSSEKEGVELPFCSKRCKLIDRARWLNEDYGLPFESENSPMETIHEVTE